MHLLVMPNVAYITVTSKTLYAFYAQELYELVAVFAGAILTNWQLLRNFVHKQCHNKRHC